MLNPTSLLRRVKKLKPTTKNIGQAVFFNFDFLFRGRDEGGRYDPVPGGEGRSASTRTGENRWKVRVVVLALLQIGLGLTSDRSRLDSDPDQEESETPFIQAASARFVLLDALKLACCLLLVYYETYRSNRVAWSPGPSGCAVLEAQPLHADEGWQSDSSASNPNNYAVSGDAKPVLFGSSRSNLIIGFLALFLVAYSYLTVYIANSSAANAVLVHFSTFLVPVFSAAFLRIFDTWMGSSQQWLGVILQILGLLSYESQSFLPDVPSSSIIFLIALGILASLICISIQNVYRSHSKSIPSKFNTRLFACGLSAHFLVLALSNLFVSSSSLLTTTSISRSMFGSFVALALRAFVDITGLNLIYNRGPVLFAVTTLMSTTFLLAYSSISSGTYSTSELCSLTVALVGFYVYWTGESQQQGSENLGNASEKKTLSLRILLTAVLFLLLGTSVYVSSDTAVGQVEAEAHLLKPDLLGSVSNNLGETMIFAELPYVPPPTLLPPEPTCARVPLHSENFFLGNRTYHEFDDVLLIVFFSHSRYDVNLEYYKEVYSEFFPNMVFVGPRNREDKGFNHSYDVLVDSYESDEDISDWKNYKMAGRMAHHMLYTVLTTPPYSNNCYKGFLWAPFDTLLNVPRLQLFDKDRIWYFSPWGEYVPNPAVDEEKWMNASNHAPPARISPDPETDFNKTYRGWWVDWWWGDPRYGIPVCKHAFERVPLELRERMVRRFTKNETRYLGGSADTVYIPARLAEDFTSLLGTFLNTSCFLEIAVPTIVHLLVPEDENILFVDHWWIWNPPFNASFVRDRWERGMEVDTFHTFHWGDKDSDGVWRANRRNIEDVRLLLRESAARQGVPRSSTYT